MYISRREVSKRLGVSISTVIRMEQAGILPPYKFGAGDVRYQKTKYKVADVEAFERESAQPVAAK